MKCCGVGDKPYWPILQACCPVWHEPNRRQPLRSFSSVGKGRWSSMAEEARTEDKLRTPTTNKPKHDNPVPQKCLNCHSSVIRSQRLCNHHRNYGGRATWAWKTAKHVNKNKP
eukprot:jgi/Chrzof1/3792/Cz13g09010.t1